jgi:hypothetical protein
VKVLVIGPPSSGKVHASSICEVDVGIDVGNDDTSMALDIIDSAIHIQQVGLRIAVSSGPSVVSEDTPQYLTAVKRGCHRRSGCTATRTKQQHYYRGREARGGRRLVFTNDWSRGASEACGGVWQSDSLGHLGYRRCSKVCRNTTHNTTTHNTTQHNTTQCNTVQTNALPNITYLLAHR